MTWLKAVPAWAWTCLALALLCLYQHHQLDVKQGEFAEYREGVERAAKQAAEKALAESQRLKDQIAEIDEHATEQISQARADAIGAQSAFDALSVRYNAAELRARACGNSLTASLSQAADTAARVRADVFQTLGNAAVKYAAIADERGIAGQTCESSYRAVERISLN